jgi:cation/acetate symporter
MLDVFCITLALMVGTAGLPHVIVRFYTVKDVRAARYSAGWALLFIALLYTTAPALAAFARFNLIDSLHGATVVSSGPSEDGTYTHYKLSNVKSNGDSLNLHWTDQWQKTKLLQFDDKNGNGKIEMSADQSNSEITTLDRDIIVLSTPEVANLAPWVIALVAAGGLAAALSTAAGLLLVISSSIAHDVYFRLINPKADEAHRVLVGRVMVLAGIGVAGYFGVNPPGFVGEVVAFAFGLAAASFFPVILLGIFDTRANREGAIAGMLVGLGFTAYYIIANRFFGHPAWCFGISAQGIGAVGMALNLAITFVVSRLTPPPPQEVQDMVAELRIPAHPGAAYIMDEGTE